MRDDLKISELEYLINRWSDLTKILTQNLCDLTKHYDCFKWEQPPNNYEKWNILVPTSSILP